MKVLVAADAPWIRNLVRSAFVSATDEVIECTSGQEVRDVVDVEEPDVAILDMQISNMGGIAVALDLRLEHAAGRLPDIAIVLLLDRPVDGFLAKRTDADLEVLTPVDAASLRQQVSELMRSFDTSVR